MYCTYLSLLPCDFCATLAWSMTAVCCPWHVSFHGTTQAFVEWLRPVKGTLRNVQRTKHETYYQLEVQGLLSWLSFFLSFIYSHPGQTEVKDGSPSVWQKEERWRTCETIWEDQRKLLNMKTAKSLRTAAELQDFIEERKSNLTRWGKLSRSGTTRFGTTMK